MLVSPPLLLESLQRRLLASGLTWQQTVAAAGANARRSDDDERLEALVVVRAFAPRDWVASALDFTASLPGPLQQAWYREFTRTSLLVGDPRRLERRFRFDHLSNDGALGWLAPRPARDHLALKRLLKPLRTRGGFQPRDDVSVRDPRGGGPRRELTLAHAGEPLESYLVQLNHCLCEAAIEGHLPVSSGLSLRHVPEIAALPPAPLHLRVRPTEGDSSRLRLYGVLH